MNENFFLAGMIFGILFVWFFTNKIIEFYREKEENSYRIQKKKLYKTTKPKKDDSDDSEDYEDFEEALPPWLEGIFEGAGINIEKFYDQDPDEMAKLRAIVDKIPIPNKNTVTDKSLIG